MPADKASIQAVGNRKVELTRQENGMLSILIRWRGKPLANMFFPVEEALRMRDRLIELYQIDKSPLEKNVDAG